VKSAYQELHHSEDSAPTQTRREREREHCLKNDHFQNTHHKQLKNENLRGYRLGTVSGKTIWQNNLAKQFATGGLNQVKGCTCPYRFSYEQTSTS
jgi:hypothetical protein